MRVHHLIVGFLSVGFIVVLTAPVLGTQKMGDRLAERFKLDPKKSCAICHDAGKGEPGSRNLNKFGKDFDGAYSKQKKGADRATKAVDAIAGEDADGDGATNVEELSLGTLPGDAKSLPAADKLVEHRKANPAK